MTTETKKNVFYEYIVETRRVVKVTKGGRVFSFRIIAIVGNQDGQFGMGSGKALDGLSARKKAVERAKANIMRVSTRSGRTLPHTVVHSRGATKIMMRPAAPGTGIVAGGSLRTLFESIGLKDVVTKVHGPGNKNATLLCAVEALSRIKSLRYMAAARDKKIKDILPPRIEDATTAEEQAV